MMGVKCISCCALLLTLGVYGCGQEALPPVPNETAAYWVLSKGGAVTIRRAGRPKRVATLAELPSAGFTVHAIDLTDVAAVPADELSAIKHLRPLEHLVLRRSGVTDAALEHLVGLKSLKRLDLGETLITDNGLEAVGACTRLMELDLSKTNVRGEGLQHLRPCWKLTKLNLSGTPLQSEHLAHLAEFRNLVELDLSGAGVSDDAVQELQQKLKYCRIIRRGAGD